MLVAIDFVFAVLFLLIVAPLLFGAFVFAALAITAGYLVGVAYVCYSKVVLGLRRGDHRSL